jgi:hypothetical protein
MPQAGSATTSDRNVATSSDTMANDKECKCDCSKQGAIKSKRRASGRSTTDSSTRRPGAADANAPRELDRDTSATGSSSSSTTGSTTDQTRPAAPATGPVDTTHTGSTTDTSKPPGTGDSTMKPSDSSTPSSNPSDPNAPKK